MAAQQTKKFQLGEQPEWAGREKNADIPISFIDELLSEDNSISLLNRGYCVIELDSLTVEYYSKFHKLIENFFNLNEKEKEKYALLQFNPNNNSPNQCHGYSQVSSLKEQFMMRCIGNNNNKNEINDKSYTFPNNHTCKEFGEFGMKRSAIFRRLTYQKSSQRAFGEKKFTAP